MNVHWRDPADEPVLRERVRSEANSKQRDRFRAVLLACDGLQEPEIARRVGRSRRFVQKWVYTYRDHGLDAIREKPRPGQPTKLPRDQEQAFKQRFLAGPTADDGGVCTLRGLDAVRILESQFGVQYTLRGVYDLLDRLGLSCLTPRPLHRKNDPAAMEAFVAGAPFLSRR